MSERFTLDVRMDMPKLLIDNYTNEKYNLLMVNDIERIVDVLNEQQARIELLEDNCLADNLTRKHLEGIINEQQATIQSLKEENRKLSNIHLSIDLTYSYGCGRYLADVRVIGDE